MSPNTLINNKIASYILTSFNDYFRKKCAYLYKRENVVYRDIRTILFTTLIIVSSATTAFGQQLSDKVKLEKLVKAFELVISDYASDSMFIENAPKWNKEQLKSIFEPEVNVNTRPELARLISHNQNLLKKDLGLDINAGFLNNFEQSLFDSEGRFYRRRYTIGTRWDLIGGGLLDNRLKAGLLEYDLEKQKELDSLLAVQKSVDIVFQRILYVFNKAKITEIQKYLTKLNQELILLRNLSDLGYDVRELFRELARKQLRYEMQIEDFKNFELDLDSTAKVNDNTLWDMQPPIFEVAIDSIQKLAIAAQYAPIDKLVKIEATKNQESYKRWRDISANLQFQYNYFDRLEEQTNNQFLNDREFFSLSGTIRIPLSIFSTNYNKTAQFNTFRYKESLELDVQNKDNELIGQFRELENRKRTIFEIDANIDVVNQRIADEKNQFEINNQNYNPALLLSHISNRQSLVVERIIALEDFYLTYYKIWRHAPAKTLDKFTNLLNSTKGEKSTLNSANLGVYLWSKELYGLSNSYLLEKIKANNINEVALSVGQINSTNRAKVSSFISDLKASDIEVSLLIGNNEIVNDTTFTKVSDWVKLAAALNLSKLHLDVEPHALSNWKRDKELLLKNYLKLLAFSSKETKLYGISLDVSIPHFYDEILSDIKNSVDFINVMVYNDLNISSIELKLQEENRILYANSWAISLRASDYSSKNQLDLFIKSVNNAFINKTVYLQDFKELDTLKN